MRQTDFQQLHFTEEGFRSLKVYRHFVKCWLAKVREADAAYEAEVKAWYETGDGAAPDYVVDTVCIACGASFDEDDTASLGDCEDTEDGKHHLSTRRYNAGGQGHTFPTCRHGSSLWTDYDNICYECEDSSTTLQIAIGFAREQFLRFNDRWEWAMSAPGDLPQETRVDITAWAMATWPKVPEITTNTDAQEG